MSQSTSPASHITANKTPSHLSHSVSPPQYYSEAMGTSAADPSAPPRPVNQSGCMPSSPSWWLSGRRRGTAVVRQLQLAARDVSPAVGWCGHRAWRKLLRRVAQETKCICSSPTAASRPITFGYDAASYAKNFDDGRRPAPQAAVVTNAADKPSGR